nr:PREDICTED: cyclin-dependent kinase inhibitor 3-like [Daucus carota subsp. sativus]
MHISFSSTRDSTPCDLIRRSDTIGTPGSSTRPASNQMSWNMMQQIQTSLEIEVYNFDVVNDLPFPGRYEWVSVHP